MAWTLVGAAPVIETTRKVVVGPVRPPLVGGLILKVSALISVPVHEGQCRISYESRFGRELGAIWVCPREVPTVYRLGDGMRVRDPSGVLVLEPRTWERRWLEAGFALSVLVLADLPEPEGSDTYTPPAIVSTDGAELPLTPDGETGRVTFPEQP